MLKSKGFTLLELLAAISIAGILAAMALPSLRDFIRLNSVTASTNQLISALNYARMQAVTLRTPVTICASSNYYNPSVSASNPTCQTSFSIGGTSAGIGWVIYSGDSTVAPTVSNVLKTIGPDLSTGSITINDKTLSPATSGKITFSSVGTASSSGNIAVCAANTPGPNAMRARVVQLSIGGRVQSMTGDSANSGFTSC